MATAAQKEQAQRYLELLEHADCTEDYSTFYAWGEAKQDKPGVVYQPPLNYTDTMFDFWPFLSSIGYGEPFEYLDWYAHFMKQHPQVKLPMWVDTLSKQDLDKLLFCLMRAERFNEGLWTNLLRKGHLLILYKKVLRLEKII